MARCLLMALIAACGGTGTLPPPPQPPSQAAPLQNQRVPNASSNLELVARCATQAVELLGWNPVPDGAHHGSVIKTSIDHGGSADCAPLVNEANNHSFLLGGEEIDWDWEPKDQADATTIRFIFTCRGCTSIESSVVLQRRWHCFSWMHMTHHGTVCHPDRGACDAARASHGPNITPCSLHTGSAWCQHGTKTCSDSPWSCANSPTQAPCDRAP